MKLNYSYRKLSKKKYSGVRRALLFATAALWMAHGSLYGAPVFYQGVAFSGESVGVEARFPYLHQIHSLSGSDGSPWLEKLFRDLIWQNRDLMPSVELRAEKGTDKVDLKALAFSFSGERISVEPIGDVYKCCINLSGQILILDFETMMVVGSYPLIWEIIHVFTDEPQPEDIITLLTGSECGLQSGFFKQPIINILPQITVKDYSGRSLRILDVGVGEDALSFLDQRYLDHLPAYQSWIAEQCGANLSSEFGLALLPYLKDASNAKMALAFSSSEVLMFTIPEPTYGISIQLDNFKKVIAKETLAERLLVYGAYITFKLYEPQFGKVYFEEAIKMGIPKRIPVSQTIVDDCAVFQEAVKNVLLKAGREVMDNKKARKVLGKCKRS